MLWELIPTKQMPKIKSNDQTMDNLREMDTFLKTYEILKLNQENKTA